MISAALLFIAGCAAQPASIIQIDFSRKKPISPYIYGANTPDWKTMHGVTLSRIGGNRMTAYNWETNASNAGNDWHFQNDGYMGESNEPGLTMRKFLEDSQSNGAAALLTVPTAGYVSADKKADGDVMQTPNWMQTRFYPSLAKKPGGHFAYPPETKDDKVYQDEFVAWIEKIKSPKTPVWYCLDNEPDIWSSTHKEIRQKPETYAGIIANNIEFASAIKGVAPNTLIFGPVNYGWQGFRTFQGASDAAGRDFLNVYLDALHDAEKTRHRRLLDVLDIHWYPEAQGGGVRIVTNEDKPGTAEARIQAPRSLWDPTYVEQSWIEDTIDHKPIKLLPRLMKLIDEHYPGTKLGITEYNYGGAKVISGALAEADVLGCFGRYGVFAATIFGMGPEDVAQIAGLKAFVDFDGAGAHFGDTMLGVSGDTPAENSIYAALDSKDPHRLTILAIDKTSNPSPLRFDLGSFKGLKIRAFAITRDNPGKLSPAEAELDGGFAKATLQPLSVTVLEIRS